MSTLAQRVTDLAAAIRDKFNLVTPKLVPPGGTTGQALTKASNVNHSLQWSAVATPTDVAAKLDATLYRRGFSGFCSGKCMADEVIGGGIAASDLTLVAAECWAKAVTAATTSTTFIIKKGATQIGSIVFAAGATIGTVSFTSTAILEGDLVTVVAPTTPDATLAGIAWLLKDS